MMPDEKVTKEYKVLKIDEMVRPGEITGIERYYRITYKTKGGVVATTNVDEKDYTPEKVAALLTKLAQAHDKILAL